MRIRGFTLIEMILVISLVGVLGSFAIPMVLETAGDAAARMDLQRAMISIKIYRTTRHVYPATLGDLQSATGYAPSRGVTFSAFAVSEKGGSPSVHMDVRHQASDTIWHADYPGEGLEIRSKTGAPPNP